MNTPCRSALLLFALLCGTGLGLDGAARAAEGTDTRMQTTFRTAPAAGALRVSKILGIDVVGQDHVRVGTIADVLSDREGRIDTVVIGTGGVLGIGEKYVAVPFSLLAWNVGDVALTGGPTSVATPRNAPSAAEAAKAGPATMPGGETTQEVLGAVQNHHSGRVTDTTGTVEASKPPAEPATVLAGAAGNAPVRAELRMTKAELAAAPAFRFDGGDKQP